ncbi:shikimate dehydrogenase [Methylococcus capsulatus]|jgi:shikimate dehydrogenase|uniref:Shikimate dehydrogenase (NADP(+)) n=1 Tax=Methylococcus capsulatus (strain ATCC 33009 / NCIMB 11132 / Bath) TaxID=243233 RepID=AROE_METCA|nr:shikimate dehydrogenase [Methylococcus capsulatus]Q603L1.1 RecName: Full=Shikimate dehydrogenase (NADP(+)); Short=SDH [Methylococcus capsulatus str. Bath]AAU91094.1 shikimate 5-dehydrogenase [Methylococcus capsulatus str. Bath]QXP86728.1 shikimate dehydrogenase [Methylococcus capsulatus]QXP93594.1 shikimate dehydrogenase [Methylococcus capsulatus]UQN11697.1 shikimate dehydrogenase [Methylococcus capsulatus]
MTQPDRYAVFGHPIEHSQSPRIHALFAAQTGQDLIYTAEDVPPDRFESCVRAFFDGGGRGLNCTIPLKEMAWLLADSRSGRAKRARAVNTLLLRADGSIFGDNTDGIGLLRDLRDNLGLNLAGTKILILGAGGATRGILAPLLAERPDRLVIANRTVATAETLTVEFGDLGPVEGCGFAALAGRRFDLIINATAASLSGELPPLPADILAPGGSCYDLAYAAEPTPFVRWGQEKQAVVSADGIGMLVEQAAEAFLLWRGVRPQTRPVIETLEAERRTAK